MSWDERTTHLIEMIYDSLGSELGWMPMLEAVADDFDSPGAHAFLHKYALDELIEECLYCVGEDVRRLDILLPHIVRALRLGRRIRRMENDADIVIAALNRLSSAALIVSHNLEIMCLNRQAETLLSDCEALRVRGGKFTPKSAEEASALRRAVAEALAEGGLDESTAPPSVVRLSRLAEHALDALAVPLRPRSRLRKKAGRTARALLLIYDRQVSPLIDPRIIERLFDLTPTEALVAAGLARGLSIAEIAGDRLCSTSTVRTHVKNIFKKTQTTRQGELVQLVLTSPAISFGG